MIMISSLRSTYTPITAATCSRTLLALFITLLATSSITTTFATFTTFSTFTTTTATVSVTAFSPTSSLHRCGNKATLPSTQLQIFGDAFKGAFANDDKLGPAQNAGLKNGPNENDKVTINGKKVKAIVGQKVSVVANAARVKISYNCQKGDCGTCNIQMNGKTVKACQMTIPSGKCDIKTL